MSTCLNRGRLRRPGRGPKITKLLIHYPASNTEILTLPPARPNAADMHFMSLAERHCAARIPSHRGSLSICGGAKGHPTACRLSQVSTKRIIEAHSISEKLPVSLPSSQPSPALRPELPCGGGPSTPNMLTLSIRSMACPAEPGSDVLEHAAWPHRHRTEPRPAITKASNEFIHERLHHAPPSIKPLDHMSSSISRSRTSAACFLAAKIKSRADSPRTQQSIMSAQHCIMMRRSAVYRATL